MIRPAGAPAAPADTGSAAGGGVLARIALHGVTAEVLGPGVLARTLGLVLRAYPEAPAAAPADVRIAAARVPGERARWTVAAGDRVLPAGPGVAAAAVWCEWLFVAEALARWTRYVHAHAAVVATARASVLLIGRSGSGKSTTSVALALDGVRLFTDDVALVDRETLRPAVVPRPVKLDPRSRRLLRARGLAIPRGTRLGESIDRTVIPGLPPVAEPGPPLAAAVFFADARGAESRLRPLTAAEAMMRLVLQSSTERFDHALPPDGATRIVNAVPCYELTAAGLDATVRTVRDLLDDRESGG